MNLKLTRTGGNILEHILRETPEKICPRCGSKSVSKDFLFYNKQIIYKVIECQECNFKSHLTLDYIPFVNEKIKIFKKL